MQDREILKLLAEEAPLIEWKIMGRWIQGTTLINAKKYAYAVPLRIDEEGIKAIAKSFREDHERKLNATS